MTTHLDWTFPSTATLGDAQMDPFKSHSHPGLANQPVPIAPAPAHSSNVPVARPMMPYACMSCTKRKIKCDKLTPICSACRKTKLECLYQAPAPRRRKRKLSGDVHEKLAEYERILRENNLLPSENETFSKPNLSEESFNFRLLEVETARLGKLLTDDEGKSRYIDSTFWRNFGDDEIPNLDDESEDEQADATFSQDPLTASLMGSTLDLTEYHPSFQEAQILWKAHVEHVEPIIKVVHIPSTSQMVHRVSAQPQTATKAEECLLFGIYHFAVFSMLPEDCLQLLQESKEVLIQRYQFAAKQALVNANFLKATDMTILQAFLLYLMPSRFSYDPGVLWIMTGVAVRLAQRMGLHRDGDKLGLPPFEVQMRRRLFFQLVPMDGMASQMSGTGIAMMPHTWDTEQPLNLNDDQIWPGMTAAEMPEEQKGATDMIFVLTRASLGLFFARTGTMGHGPPSGKHYPDIEPLIMEAEREVEENYLRYCDVINPLHFLTMSLARAAINAMRIRVRLPKVRDKSATRAEKQEILQFALKILDTDAAAYTNGGLRKYLWHARAFFAWGSWDSLIFILTTLRSVGVFTPAEVDAGWQRIEQAYINHGELLGFRRSIQTIAIARLVIRAWDTNPPSNSVPAPAFIVALRSMRKVSAKKQEQDSGGNASSSEPATASGSSDPSPPSDMHSAFDNLSGDMNVDVGTDFDLDTTDWVFWEKMIKDFQ